MIFNRKFDPKLGNQCRFCYTPDSSCSPTCRLNSFRILSMIYRIGPSYQSVPSSYSCIYRANSQPNHGKIIPLSIRGLRRDWSSFFSTHLFLTNSKPSGTSFYTGHSPESYWGHSISSKLSHNICFGPILRTVSRRSFFRFRRNRNFLYSGLSLINCCGRKIRPGRAPCLTP